MEAGAKPKKSGARGKGPTTIARAYFDALAGHDLDRAVELWEPGCVDHVVGIAELRAPEEFRSWFGNLFAAFPDFRMEIVSLAASKENAAVRWRATGTFDGSAHFEGMAPNGASVEIEGCDMLTIRDGRIVDNHAYINAADLARQLGAMPPQGSIAEKGLIGAFNAKTAAARGIQQLRERRSGRG